jgi:hypothetical protein
MRIGQLARRLGITPTEILGFLGSQNIEESGTNSRLSAEMVAKVINHFAPGRLAEIMATPAETPIQTPVETPVEEPVAEATEVAEPTPEPPEVENQSEPEPASEESVEVIRVSKVELQGLKVLGKIDLPEKKKKAEEEPAEQKSESRPRREFQKGRDREWKNPLEVKRQQEQRERERKKQEEADKLKEKRTNHYYNKVKSVPTKAARRIEEQTVVEDIEIEGAPKGLVGRFFRWLRS